MSPRRSALALACLVLAVGCLGAPSASPTPESPPPTTTRTPTPFPVSVEYAVTAGSLPPGFASVRLTLRVVFVQRATDIGPCWRDTFDGPYKPTPTPVPTPAGECWRSAPVTVDLADVNGTRSLGTFSAPGRVTAGHGLIVTDIRAIYENGTEVDGIRGVGGLAVHIVEGTPGGSYRVEFRIESYRDRPYDYWLVSETTSGSE